MNELSGSIAEKEGAARGSSADEEEEASVLPRSVIRPRKKIWKNVNPIEDNI